MPHGRLDCGALNKTIQGRGQHQETVGAPGTRRTVADIMRICFVAGPGSIHTQRWVGWFVNRGHEVHVVFPHSFLRTGSFRLSGAVMHRLEQCYDELLLTELE